MGNGTGGGGKGTLNVFEKSDSVNFPFRAAGQMYIEGASVSVGPNHKKASKNL